MYEVELVGFDPKEDAKDGGTSKICYVNTNQTNHSSIIREAIRQNPFKRTGVYWNPKLSKVILLP